MDGTVNKVVGGRFLCHGCIDTVDARADSLVYDPDSDFDDIKEAFKHVVDENVGKTLILHYPDGKSPNSTHTHTVEHVKNFEIEFDDENKVTAGFVDGGSQTFVGRGLTVSGMS